MKRLTVDLPEDIMGELKLMKIIHDKPMREIIIEAIRMFSEQPIRQKERHDLKQRVHMIEHSNL